MKRIILLFILISVSSGVWAQDYYPKMTNISSEFYAIASSEYEKRKDNFKAIADNVLDGNPDTYWMSSRPIRNYEYESIVLVMKDKVFVEAVKMDFLGQTVWNGTTNDLTVRNFNITVRSDGKDRTIKSGYNAEQSPVYAVNLSNVDRIQILVVGGGSDGYARIRDISVYGMMTEKSSNTYKYKMSAKEEKLLAQSSVLYRERHLPVTEDDGAGMIRMSKGYYQSAMDRVIDVNRDVLKENPKNPYARMNLGQVYAELGNNADDTKERDSYMAKSEKELLAADRKDNPELKGLYKYLMSFYREKLDEKNYSVYEQKLLALTTGEGNKGEYYRTLANSDPYGDKYGGDIYKYASESGDLKGFGTVLWRYTTLLVRQKKYEKAVEVGNFTIQGYPNLERVQDGQVYQFVALANMALGKWQDAIEAWKGYYNHNPIETGPLYIAYCYLKINDIEQAYNNYALFKLWEDNSKIYDKWSVKIKDVYDPLYRKYRTRDGKGIYIRGANKYGANMEGINQIKKIISAEIKDINSFASEVLENAKKGMEKYNIK